MVYGVLAFAWTFWLAFVLTGPVCRVARRIGAMDVPKDERRMHTTPIPRLGGLAVFLSFSIFSLVFASPSPPFAAIWNGGLLLVATGIADDLYPLLPLPKLAMQGIAAVTAVLCGVQVGDGGAFSVILTVLWIVAMTNALNFLDGLDGLACTYAVIAFLAFFGICTLSGNGDALLPLLLAGSCLGFLPFNRPPARIFMGDTGSLFLGYALSVCALSLPREQMPLSLWVLLLPLADLVSVTLLRLFHGRNPFSADKTHLHHRLVGHGLTHLQTTMFLCLLSLSLCLSALAFLFAASLSCGMKIILLLTPIAAVCLPFLILFSEKKNG